MTRHTRCCGDGMVHDTGNPRERWRSIRAARRSAPKLEMANSAPLKWQSRGLEDSGILVGKSKTRKTGKRIWFGLVLCIGCGALIAAARVLVPLPASQTPLEFHKKEYLSARYGTDRWKRARGDSPSHQARVDQMRFHQHALIKVGYLRRREFVISNRSASEVQLNLMGLQEESLRFVTVEPRGKNKLVIVAPGDDMPMWENLVREADIPK